MFALFRPTRRFRNRGVCLRLISFGTSDLNSLARAAQSRLDQIHRMEKRMDNEGALPHQSSYENVDDDDNNKLAAIRFDGRNGHGAAPRNVENASDDVEHSHNAKNRNSKAEHMMSFAHRRDNVVEAREERSQIDRAEWNQHQNPTTEQNKHGWPSDDHSPLLRNQKQSATSAARKDDDSAPKGSRAEPITTVE